MLFLNALMPYVLATHHHIMHISCLFTSLIILFVQDIPINHHLETTCNIPKNIRLTWWINQPNAAFYWMLANNFLNIILSGFMNILKVQTQKHRRYHHKYQIRHDHGYLNTVLLIIAIFGNLISTMIGQSTLFVYYQQMHK